MLTEQEKNYIEREAKSLSIEIEVLEEEEVKHGTGRLEFTRGVPELLRRETLYTVRLVGQYLPNSRQERTIQSLGQWNVYKSGNGV